jgi:CDGSH-type Zn-finger protein
MEAAAAGDPPAAETPLEPVVAKRGPFVCSVNTGTLWWCSCGRSQAQPFCDGAHQGTGFEPLAFGITEDRRVALCGCKRTQNPPFCDGSHTRI